MFVAVSVCHDALFCVEAGLPVFYTQGMNVLAAPFLYLLPEPHAFACFERLISDVCLKLVYGLEGTHAGVRLVEELLFLLDPELYTAIRSVDMNATIYAFGPVMTMCASLQPLEQVLELWDVFLAFGPYLNVLAIASHMFLHREQLMAGQSIVAADGTLPPITSACAIVSVMSSLIGLIPEYLLFLLSRYMTNETVLEDLNALAEDRENNIEHYTRQGDVTSSMRLSFGVGSTTGSGSTGATPMPGGATEWPGDSGARSSASGSGALGGGDGGRKKSGHGGDEKESVNRESGEANISSGAGQLASSGMGRSGRTQAVHLDLAARADLLGMGGDGSGEEGWSDWSVDENIPVDNREPANSGARCDVRQEGDDNEVDRAHEAPPRPRQRSVVDPFDAENSTGRRPSGAKGIITLEMMQSGAYPVGSASPVTVPGQVAGMTADGDDDDADWGSDFDSDMDDAAGGALQQTAAASGVAQDGGAKGGGAGEASFSSDDWSTDGGKD